MTESIIRYRFPSTPTPIITASSSLSTDRILGIRLVLDSDSLHPFSMIDSNPSHSLLISQRTRSNSLHLFLPQFKINALTLNVISP